MPWKQRCRLVAGPQHQVQITVLSQFPSKPSNTTTTIKLPMKFVKTLRIQVLGTTLLAVGTALPVWADYQSTILSQDPVGYWRLNETTVPSPIAGAANLGTLGAAALGTYDNFPTRGLPGPFAGSV